MLGPCPGCEMWTVEYDGSEWDGELADVLEGVLQDHYRECRDLQNVVGDLDALG